MRAARGRPTRSRTISRTITTRKLIQRRQDTARPPTSWSAAATIWCIANTIEGGTEADEARANHAAKPIIIGSRKGQPATGLTGGRWFLADHEGTEAGAQGGEAAADVGECCGSIVASFKRRGGVSQ